VTAVFEVKRDGRGPLVICRIGEQFGAARVFSAGEEDARKRAEAQARAKEAKRGPAE